MKQIVRPALLILTAVALFLPSASASHFNGSTLSAPPDHGFSVKEYEDFHEVLHPLEHEALPNNDFKTIRARAGELVTLGGRIVKIGVPRGVEDKNAGEFKEWLRKFDEALGKFQRDAESDTDDALRESYSAVHDSFEMLAGMLPRK